MKLTKHKRLSNTHTNKEIHKRDLKKSKDNLINNGIQSTHISPIPCRSNHCL